MTGKSLDREGSRELSHPEVDFALVLARTIDSIQTDPEQLRGAIYELARKKLQEQFTTENAADIGRLNRALEVAIQGVEAHYRDDQQRLQALGISHISALPARNPLSYAARKQTLERPPVNVPDETPDPVVTVRPISIDVGSSRSGRSAILLRLSLVLGVILVAALTIRSQPFGILFKDSSPLTSTSEPVGKSQSQPEPQPITAEPPKQNPLVPTTFGIYAISAGKLYELEPLQMRAPDIRVAVSTPIKVPSRTMLPDGNLKFIVFRRDALGNAPDQLDVRVVARIGEAMTFDASGKPVVSEGEESWVIRNIAFPYRTAPVKDNPEMYEVQGKDPGAGLTPGRYVLVIKGQAFDFAVAGNVSDPRQCLSRVAASNGTFYSECQGR